MYAVVECKGRQYLVKNGEKIKIDRSKEEIGKTLNLRALLVKDKEKLHLGKPWLKNCVVTGEVVSHFKGKKNIAFKYRRRKGYEVKKGFRPLFSTILIKEIKIS